MYKLLILLLLCISSAYSLNIAYKSGTNVSGSVTDNGWQYRRTTLRAWQYPALIGLFKGFNFVSVSAVRNKHSGSTDVLSGSVYVNINQHILSFFSYFSSSSQWSIDVNNETGFALDVNLQAAKGYLGVAFLRLEENDADGNIVNFHSLTQTARPSRVDGVTWVVSDHSTAGADLKYVTFTGTPENPDWYVELTFAISAVAGVIDETNTPITPKTVESFIHISNYPYASANNTLTLVLGVGTGGATLSASGSALVSGTLSDDSQVFFSLSKQAIVGGSTKDATISYASNTTADIGDNANFYAQLTSVYGATATYHTARVTFPAGASDIIYDPSQGSGAPAEGTQPSFASKTILSLSLMVVASLSCFIL